MYGHSKKNGYLFTAAAEDVITTRPRIVVLSKWKVQEGKRKEKTRSYDEEGKRSEKRRDPTLCVST